ncbi:MAG: hypothetical protein F4X82_02250 [Candidatus Spechtbacteria bacterium SB0662_bin_43]|uniref:Uncharacterized protein n=1 Tax=Candidatus Spechtbacteria bacterium SB0662_bin_43 TaxID=2604897 RepID=A0A845DB95_9BACT|nr:hypothetical protein [Candidatus Spechtbacteria bacterium SB0662_bin_43]
MEKDKLERVREILKNSDPWELANLESEGYVDRDETVIQAFIDRGEYEKEWERQTENAIQNIDEYIEKYVNEEYADAIIAWGKEIH